MFRVRKGFLSGNAILQVREDGRWVDADVMPDLERGFNIVSDAYLRSTEEELRMVTAELQAIYATRSRAARDGWAKKRAPVLQDRLAPGLETDLANQSNRSVYTRPRG